MTKINFSTAATCAAAIFIGLGAQHASATAIVDVSEISGFTQIYQLDMPSNANYNGANPAYNIDNSASGPSNFDRIGYYMELESSAGGRQWAWASMDAFTQDLSLIGVPVNTTWDQGLNNLNVQSNVGSVTIGTGISTGSIEFWDNCYVKTGGNSAIYDHDDTQTSTNNCYGSMQIHNGVDTIMAWNSWESGNTDDLGIGSSASANTDWTFARNAQTYTIRNLEMWVSSDVPEPGTYLLIGLGLAGMAYQRKRKILIDS